MYRILYAVNYKMLMKEIKESLNKWRDLVYSWIERLRIGIVKMSVLPKCVYRFNINPVEISVTLLVSIDKFILKFI